MCAKKKEKEPMLSTSDVRYAPWWELENAYADYVERSIRRGEGYPKVFPSVSDAVEAAQSLYWVCEGGRIHTCWVATLSRNSKGRLYSPMVVVPGLGGDPFKPGCGCSRGPGEGWGGRLTSRSIWGRTRGPAIAGGGTGCGGVSPGTGGPCAPTDTSVGLVCLTSSRCGKVYWTPTACVGPQSTSKG